MYLCRPRKHSCQPFCGPEGRFYCSDSVCFLWPAPFSYLCVSVSRDFGVCWKLSAAEQVKPDCCHTPAVVSTLLTPLPVSCSLTTPLHYIYIYTPYTISCRYVDTTPIFGMPPSKPSPLMPPKAMFRIMPNCVSVSNFYVQMRDLCSILTHTYFQSDWDS